jgi:hypothetical protein
MTCKDVINSDTNSDDKKEYLLNENGNYKETCKREERGCRKKIDKNHD